MNRAALLRRLQLLEAALVPPPSFERRVIESLPDEQLDALEIEIDQGRSELWDALVASHLAGESGS